MENKIIIGSDHAGYYLKEKVKVYLIQLGLNVVDAGTNNESSVDYPDIGKKVAEDISTDKFKKGILICGTGIGMSMVANRFGNVRAALCINTMMASLSRRHNDSNLLVLGARIMDDIEVALEIVYVWLETKFEGGRHKDRLLKMDKGYIDEW